MRDTAFFAPAGAVLVFMAAGCSSNPTASCEGASPSPTYQCCASSSGPPAWIDIFNDPRNCGGCGTVCLAGQFCRAGTCAGAPATDGGGPTGMCTPACASSQRCCGTSCIGRSGVALGSDGRADPTFMNCSSCGAACEPDRASACSVPGGGMGTPRCMCGVFDQCPAGRMCLRSGTDFQCVDLMNDPNNCGMPGRRCDAASEDCVAGVCTARACPAEGSPCSGSESCCESGCTDLMTDPMNCGMCGLACTPGETCSGGMCRCGTEVCVRPTPPTFFGDAPCGEMCCEGRCIPVDETHCGSCAPTECTGRDTCGRAFDFLSMSSGPIMCGSSSGLSIWSECPPPPPRPDAGMPESDGGTSDSGTSDAGGSETDAGSIGEDAGTG